MNTTNILERNITGQPYVPDRHSPGNRQIPQCEVDSPIFYGSPKPVDADIVIPIYTYTTRMFSWLIPYPTFAAFWIVTPRTWPPLAGIS